MNPMFYGHSAREPLCTSAEGHRAQHRQWINVFHTEAARRAPSRVLCRSLSSLPGTAPPRNRREETGNEMESCGSTHNQEANTPSHTDEVSKGKVFDGKSQFLTSNLNLRAKSFKVSSERQHGPPGCNLYVYHCPWTWDDHSIKNEFAKYGNIVSAKIMKHNPTVDPADGKAYAGASKGCGFVSFDNPIAAQQAIEGMNGQEREGKRLKVELKRETHALRQELLTLPEDELGRVLEGNGRARMVWKMLRQGQDPVQGAVSILKNKEKFLVQTKPGTTSTFRQKLTALERIMLEAQGLDPDAHATQEFCMGPKAAEKLRTSGLTMPRAQIKEQTLAPCGTRKLLIQLHDGQSVETVVIPAEHSVSKRSRTTVCVSSQVGCARGCVFCATGKLGLLRNLSASEILMQVFLAQQVASEAGLTAVSNVVFMGQGEPLNNWRQVSSAVKMMTGQGGFQLSHRKVTLSTVAPSVAHVERLSSLPCALAWSLHAADDAVRRRLVPTQGCHVQELRDAFLRVIKFRGPGHHLFVEVTLLKDINDSEEDAKKMAVLLQPLLHVHGGGKLNEAGYLLRGGAKVNLLAYNDNFFEGLAPASEERMRAFREVLVAAGFVCTLRRARGAPQSAACGQLSGKSRSLC